MWPPGCIGSADFPGRADTGREFQPGAAAAECTRAGRAQATRAEHLWLAGRSWTRVDVCLLAANNCFSLAESLFQARRCLDGVCGPRGALWALFCT